MLHPELYLEPKHDGKELHFRIETIDGSYPRSITKDQAKRLSEIFTKFANGENTLSTRLILIDN